MRTRLIDEAGNVSAWSVRTPALFDETPPVVTATGAANAIAVRAVDTLSGMAEGTLRYRVDNATDWTPINGGSIDVPATPGHHVIDVEATDAAGNVSTDDPSATGRFEVTVIDPDAGKRDDVTVITPPAPEKVIETVRDLSTHSGGQLVVIDRGAWNGINATERAKVTGWFQAANKKRKTKLGKGKTKKADPTKPSGITKRTIKANQRTVIRGRLVNDRGVGIGNARLDLIAEIPGGTVVMDKGGVRTRPDGNWTLVVPKDQTSRKLTFAYRPRVNDQNPVSSTQLRLSVLSRVTLKVGTARAGTTTRFSGSVSRRHLPKTGIQVALQYLKGGRWQTFSTPRTDSKGRWKLAYRFGQRATWKMRVTIPTNGAYPYKKATSAVRTVRVR